MSDELNIDLAQGGTVFGSELLNTDSQLEDLLRGSLVIENAATSQWTEVWLT